MNSNHAILSESNKIKDDNTVASKSTNHITNFDLDQKRSGSTLIYSSNNHSCPRARACPGIYHTIQ